MTPDDLASRAGAEGIEILLVSTLMLSSALRVRRLREALHAAGSSARLVVGGAPFRLDPTLWREVGADALGASASDALELVSRLGEGQA